LLPALLVEVTAAGTTCVAIPQEEYGQFFRLGRNLLLR
jgi:hypothetical protein